jgi:hypothetical protein
VAFQNVILLVRHDRNAEGQRAAARDALTHVQRARRSTATTRMPSR